MGFVPLVIYTARCSLLSSTCKLRYPLSFDSLKPLGPLLRNLSTAAERLGFLNLNPTGTSSYHTGFVNGDQSLGGFQQDSYGQRLNPDSPPVSGHNPNGFYQSSELFDHRQRDWQNSSSYACSSYGNDNQVNAGFVQSPSQSWDSQNGGRQVQSDNHANAHFHQDYSGLDSLDALCREGNVKEAVDIIKSWRNEGYLVDLARLLWLAQLCGDAQALQEAKVIHEFITSSVSRSDISAHNSVIEMYSGCESVGDALSVFESIPEKNSRTWCGIIRCLAKNGHEEDAVDMFSRFKEEGNRPDGEIFKEVFFACGVLGDINEGLLHFESMNRDYGIVPSMEHYVSIVKMLAEPGYLDEALRFVELVEPNAVELWETLMDLARVHGDLELGERCQDMVEQIDGSRLKEESKAGLVPVKPSDIAKEKLQRMARGRKFGGEQFMAAGDISFPENREYYMALKSLKEHMVELGYVPESKLALHDVDKESKDENLFNHTEKFAFVSSFLNTPARSPVRVLKNLRVCIDCHNALKLMSKVVGRVLVSRDVKRFHHMSDGVCSCRDYW
ncbi:Pentatricopeptide repeat-containing protein [Raphanus sativus]|uniref:Pentatricopeptide repeat-containing protein At4g32450, mitochondrial isoform X1 n=1 Tax=Raphanus sativus TaxID=3726 RepID=A0A9W3D855_RAPSA|nr:pentatricopeptide repeat-containing protein At4g32450, mitochondrial isoform X1 [Raphanus sativus]KAJ4913840.1 Pentatricopeptide repeat-containing protein [Raphanus sativus]